jgi:uncharacterized membrane protein YbhN (UPF0104 family)
LLRGLAYVASIGLALHLVLPQVVGLERATERVLAASPILVLSAFVAEVLSELCYARLLQSSLSGSRRSLSGSPPGLPFFLRLTITGYGAAHVLPGGGATASAIDFWALRNRGYESSSVGRSLAAVAATVYLALGLLFAGSLLYLLADGDLDAGGAVGAVALLCLPALVAAGAYAASKNPRALEKPLSRAIYAVVRPFRRSYGRPADGRLAAQARARRPVGDLKGEYLAARSCGRTPAGPPGSSRWPSASGRSTRCAWS